MPPTCHGHIGYSVVPWKRKRGYATEALRLMLSRMPSALPYVDVSTQDDNIGSQKTIMANGGRVVERFRETIDGGERIGLRYRINLTPT